MAEVLLNVNNHGEFRRGDMLIYDGKMFISVRKEHILKDIPELYQRIEDLRKQVELLELTLKYDHGEISEEEFEELCGKK